MLAQAFKWATIPAPSVIDTSAVVQVIFKHVGGRLFLLDFGPLSLPMLRFAATIVDIACMRAGQKPVNLLDLHKVSRLT